MFLKAIIQTLEVVVVQWLKANFISKYFLFLWHFTYV